MDRWLTWFYYSQGSESFKGDLYFYSVDHDLREDLERIDGRKCPVIMMTGTYDYLTTPEMTENTARRIKGGVYIEMEDIGHFPMSENPDAFLGYLRPVLDEILDRFPLTFELTLAALLVSVVIAIPLGVLSATRRNGPVDTGTSRVGASGEPSADGYQISSGSVREGIDGSSAWAGVARLVSTTVTVRTPTPKEPGAAQTSARSGTALT
jgi:hypothetical protein